MARLLDADRCQRIVNAVSDQRQGVVEQVCHQNMVVRELKYQIVFKHLHHVGAGYGPGHV